ncbi:MAG TPA: hypothetical protein PLR28_13800 [Dokdonella sp.]|nr:hypothetical protein [Dokdonella sp.]
MDFLLIDAGQLELYRHYDGDADGLSRSADRTAQVSDRIWQLIDDLRQRSFIVESGRGALSFRAALEADLSKHIPNKEVLDSLLRIVASDIKEALGKTPPQP